MKISEIGEDELIARLVAGLSQGHPDVLSGPGDDCAVVDGASETNFVTLLKTDCLVESVHFLPGTDPEKVGWKALCRAISDVAAMGGRPQYALVTLAVNAERPVAELEGWYRGLNAAARRFGPIAIIGGETSRLPSPGAVISVALTGQARRDRFLTRGGARPGDLVAVTGRLGGSLESGRHLDFSPRLDQGQWLAALEPRLRPTAMMDLSDGLARDLPRLANRSGGLGYAIDLSLLPRHPGCSPEQAAGDGEDYELLMTLAPADWPQLLRLWEEAFPALPLTVIGEMTSAPQRTALSGGWEHFPHAPT